MVGLVGVALLVLGNVGGRLATVETVKLVDYQEKGLIFKYPEGWTVTSRIQDGQELLQMIDFLAADKSVYGIIQVWRPRKSLDRFIEDSKESQADNIELREIKKIRMGEREGYFIEYSWLPKEPNPKVKPVEVRDFIFEEEGHFFRLMYSLPNASWDEENKRIFEEMVKSIGRE